MSNGYSPELTVERINNNGNYEPGNCKLVDRDTQAQNRNNNALTMEKARSIRADPRPYSELAEEYGVSGRTIHSVRSGQSWKE